MASIKSTTEPGGDSEDGGGANTASSLGPRPAEVKLAPGIYFTPSRSSVANSKRGAEGTDGAMPAPPNVDDMTREELEFEYRSISKTVEKLGESNDLMKKFDPKGEDHDLIDAIRENTDIIIRSRLRLIAVKSRLDHLIRTQPHIKPSRPNALAERLAAATNVPNIAQSVSDAIATDTPTSTTENATATATAPVSQTAAEPDGMNGMDL